MRSRASEVNKALEAKTDEELEESGSLFDTFLEDINNEDFDDFDSFYTLATFLIENFWPNIGMFTEISSQLFSEFELGSIDWIWEAPEFQDVILKFLNDDLHFGCFVLTEQRSNEDFTERFAKLALDNECAICAEIGDGWISPKSYVCEDPYTKSDTLKKFFEMGKNLYSSGEDEGKYTALMIFRSLAQNPNTPIEILEYLSEIKEKSLRHEIRNLNSGMTEEEAQFDAFVSNKALETLEDIK